MEAFGRKKSEVMENAYMSTFHNSGSCDMYCKKKVSVERTE
jgi:hypothetical protein